MESSPRGHRPAPRRLTSAAVVALTTVLLGWSAAVPAAADTVEFTISDSRITESSGLATDADNDRFWTTNDSGDDGIAYALDDSGDVEGTLEFRADPVDVEAVAFHDGRLYVADIGDNSAKRDNVTVYFFDDAAPSDQPVIYKAYDFSYPDGAHNAETLLVDGDGRLFIVTKGSEGGIYAAPASPERQGVNELERVGDAPAYVTDGTVLPDGRFALRTYLSVEIVDPGSYEVVARAAVPIQKQGESITTTFDGKALLIGSEGKKSTVLRIDIPTSVAEAPAPSPSPPKATPSASPSATDEPETAEPSATSSESPAADDPATDDPGTDPEPVTEETGMSRGGTLAALGLAAMIAVVAGAVVVLARHR